MKLLTGILALSLSLASVAGEIINKNNGHYITMEYSESEGLIDIKSSTELNGKVIVVNEFNEETAEALKNGSIIPVSASWFGDFCEPPEWHSSTNPTVDCVMEVLNPLALPFIVALSAGSVAIDVVALPFRIFNRVFGSKAKHKKDIQIILKASFSDESFNVGGKRFERIIQKLNGNL